ncbi:hypothetical protein RLOatenuis_6200 [Rickettsiales bacterium]|nr:hypothetical protein RLOatenuis_6200 [Rickettsiales bacterium]
MSKGLAGKFIVALTCAPQGWLRAGHGFFSIMEGMLSLPIKFLQGGFQWLVQGKTHPNLFSAAKSKVTKGCSEIRNNWIQLLELAMFVGMLLMFAMPISLILGCGMVVAMCFVVRGIFQVPCPKEVLYEQPPLGTEQKKTPGCLDLLNSIICAPVSLLRGIVELVSSLVYAIKAALFYLVANKSSSEYHQSSENCIKFSAYYAISSLNKIISSVAALLLFLPMKILSWFAPERAEQIFGFFQESSKSLAEAAKAKIAESPSVGCCSSDTKQEAAQHKQFAGDSDKTCAAMDTNISETSTTRSCGSKCEEQQWQLL